MARDGLGSAGFSIRQQVEIFGHEAVSLTSLWRAVGRPSGHDPRAWALLAEPLIAGFARYRAGLDPDSDRPVVWTWNGDDGEPWHVGDLMGHGDLAGLYAAYLDAIDDGPSVLALDPTARRGC
jgi:hypothetical protein